LQILFLFGTKLIDSGVGKKRGIKKGPEGPFKLI
jgi:hypothetical protein